MPGQLRQGQDLCLFLEEYQICQKDKLWSKISQGALFLVLCAEKKRLHETKNVQWSKTVI